MKKRYIIIGILLSLVLALGSCSGSASSTPPQTSTSLSNTTATQAPSGQSSVSIANFAFEPKSLTISIGTTVTWTNNDPTDHTVNSDNNLFDGGPLGQDKTFSFTFNQAGNFTYHCKIHPSMTGTIIVK